MKKKLLSLFMSLSLIAGGIIPVSAYECNFYDVGRDHWAYDHICEMTSRGVLSGYPDNSFRPDKKVTRAEFAKIMTSAAGAALQYPNYPTFDDVDSYDWYFPYVETAKYYLSGYETYYGYYYMPDDLALREDIAVAMVKLKGYSTDGYDLSLLQTMFSDYQSISNNAQKYVAIAVEKGLISGYDDGTFRGQDSITRAEAATLLYQAYKFGNDNKDFEPIEEDEVKKTQNPDSEKETEITEEPKKITDASEPDEEEETIKSAYKVDTLATANVSDTYLTATQDNNDNLYYYDSDTDAVYKLNMKNGKASKILDVSELTYEIYEDEEQEVTKTVTEKVPKAITEEPEEETTEDESSEDGALSDENSAEEAETEVDYEEVTTEVTTTEIVSVLKGRYKDFYVEQLYYNTGNNKLLLVGSFSAYKSERSLEDKSDYKRVIIEADNTDAVYDSSLISRRSRDDIQGICGNMDNGNVIQSVYSGPWGNNGHNIINIDTDKKINNLSGIYDYGATFCYSKGNKLYYGMGGKLYEYNFSQNKPSALWDDTVGHSAFGMNNKMYYSWDINKGEIYKIASDGKPQKLDLNTKTDIDVNDFYGMPTSFDYCYERIFITNDESFVFYDKNADGGTWRKIEKQ